MPGPNQACRSERPAHGDAVAAVLAEAFEAVLLVERQQWIVVARDAQAQRAVALGTRPVDQRLEERFAEPPAATARNNRDRELRRLLVHEPVARMAAVEQPVPRGPDREPFVDGDQRRVPRPPPAF